VSLTTYFAQIGTTAKSLVAGMAVTLRYLVRPREIVTIQYGSKKHAPKERYIPDRHRGIHFLETEKCIFCHICEKACPVDCIAMDGTRDGGFDGAWQGDGVVLSRFTLDLNKCIFCNLCCEPCPKECIHMGLEFDTAAYDRANGVKNLLTDAPWTEQDRGREAKARDLIAQVEAEAKRKKAEAAAKKKAEAAAKAPPTAPSAGQTPPAPVPPAAPPQPPPAASS
jgi:formate hydrogenlyase subunit 6/NADH:ubiquinone oxidoreductase subunit I